MQLTWVDWAILGLLAISVLVSVMRGFIREGLSLLSWVLALWLAVHYTPALSHMLVNKINSHLVRIPLSFIAILVPALIIGGIINRIIASCIHKVGLGVWDHLIGGVFGFVRGVLIISVLLLLAKMGSFSQSDWWHKSLLIPQFDLVLKQVQHLLPKQVSQVGHLSHWSVVMDGG